VILSSGIKWFFFAVILINNIFFGLFWVYHFIKRIKIEVYIRYEKYYIHFCGCFYNSNLKKEIASQEFHDMKREEFMSSNLYLL